MISEIAPRVVAHAIPMTYLILFVQTSIRLDLGIFDNIVHEFGHLIHVLWILTKFGNSNIQWNVIRTIQV